MHIDSRPRSVLTLCLTAGHDLVHRQQVDRILGR